MSILKSLHDRRGFTLVEVMVAMVIMLVGMLGLLQSVNLALEHNIRNQQRDEATRVAEDVMRGMRAAPFGTAFNLYTTIPSSQQQANRRFTVRRRVTAVSSSERYQVDVRWAYKNYSASHSIVSVRGVR